MADILTLGRISPADGAFVGGKALGLSRMIAAGLPVPPGFCITTRAYHCLDAAALRTAYCQLGSMVAVRSSAPAEDGATASFAGQQESVLGVRDEAALLAAIERCWASLDSERANAYRQRQGVEERAMAVVVQRFVPAESAGVLFTCDPHDLDGTSMLVEASWGLGESVVAGRVMPDRYRLDRNSGRVLEQHVAMKTTMIGVDGEQVVPTEMQDRPCLDERQLAGLAELGRRVEALFGEARDVEWAWAEGRFWLLQARAITAPTAAEREKVRREEIAALAARAEPTGTVWSRFNLSEVLPEPTPMTWAIVRRFMSGRGGFGMMYRDLGFDPDPALDEEGIFDLVCGRPYCNLSREPRMHFRGLPFEHPFAGLKAAPQKALYPQPVLNPARAGWAFWLLLPFRLPALVVKMTRAEVRRQRLAQTFAHRFRAEIVPDFIAEVDRAATEDLARLDPPLLVERLEHWIQRTLHEFARESLKPTALAAFAMGSVERKLAKLVGVERSKTALRELLAGVRADPEADLPGAVRDLAAGRMERGAFLKRFGHRGSREMELSQPRWSEDPTDLNQMTGTGSDSPPTADATSLTPAQQAALAGDLEALRTFLGLRETAKHYLMMGYALIRRILVELDRRFRLNGCIFYLTPADLPQLLAGEDLSGALVQARRRRSIALSLDVPSVLFSDDLEVIGRPTPVTGTVTWQGVGLSAGVAEGPALVLGEPTPMPSDQGYILVCPSTDPAWVPLFIRARGLAMETGGMLSHGAIVAREFGLPAVAGLPNLRERIKNGQRLRVDGNTGIVTLLAK